MKNCPDLEERVNDYLDDGLAPAGRVGLERHLEGCAGCREFLAALRSLREKTAALHRSLEPERDLWPEIHDSIAARRHVWTRVLRVLRIGPAVRPRVEVFLAAAAAVVLIVAAWMVLRPVGAPDAGPGSGGVSPPSAVPLLEAGYGGAVEQLRNALHVEGTGGSPAAVKVIEQNLSIVEEAIREMHRAAAIDPAHALDQRLCTRLFRARFELLRRAVRLSSQGGKETSS